MNWVKGQVPHPSLVPLALISSRLPVLGTWASWHSRRSPPPTSYWSLQIRCFLWVTAHKIVAICCQTTIWWASFLPYYHRSVCVVLVRCPSQSERLEYPIFKRTFWPRITKFCVDIHTDVLNSHTGYDVTNYFGRQLSWKTVQNAASDGFFWNFLRPLPPHEILQPYRGKSASRTCRIWQHDINSVPLTCNMQLNTVQKCVKRSSC